jgi:hypothetical protein
MPAASACDVPGCTVLNCAKQPCNQNILQGFPSKLRAPEQSELDSDAAELKRAEEARASLINLAVAWGLVVLCCSHHFGHLLHMMGYHQFAHTQFMQVGLLFHVLIGLCNCFRGQQWFLWHSLVSQLFHGVHPFALRQPHQLATSGLEPGGCPQG